MLIVAAIVGIDVVIGVTRELVDPMKAEINIIGTEVSFTIFFIHASQIVFILHE